MEIAEPLVGDAHVGEQDVERRLVHPPALMIFTGGMRMPSW